MESVLIAGGTGLIGTELTDLLLSKGYMVSHLTRRSGRNSRREVKQYVWNVDEDFIEDGACEHDHIINLAGADISEKRWTSSRKKVIYTSRVHTNELLSGCIQKLKNKPKSFISASGIAYYGAVTGTHVFTETDKPGNDFLAHVTQDWEKATEKAGVRTVLVRTAIVLSKSGGALAKLKKAAQLHVLSPLGSGDQIFPWIHIRDLADFYLYSIRNERIAGPYNLVSDDLPTNREFVSALVEKINKKQVLPPVPGWALKLGLGQIAEVLLNGSPVSNSRLKSTGFELIYPSLNSALSDVLK